jgi:hypothetical protein
MAENVFDSWTAALKDGLERTGVEPDRAEELAVVIISTSEGATGLSRAARSREPLERVGRRLATMVRAELTESPRATPSGV